VEAQAGGAHVTTWHPTGKRALERREVRSRSQDARPAARRNINASRIERCCVRPSDGDAQCDGALLDLVQTFAVGLTAAGRIKEIVWSRHPDDKRAELAVGRRAPHGPGQRFGQRRLA
jgi:hypothetical protein